ncbi:MAG: OmpA family protein [Bacteroidota bacterium]
MKYYALLFLLLTGFCVKTQTIFGKYTIYFESGKHTVTSIQKQKLDSFVLSLANIPSAFCITVKGHTDNKGSIELNERLSKKRSEEIIGYLKRKGFKTADSSVNYFAFNLPAFDNTPDNLWKNRRVELTVYTQRIDMPAILGIKDFTPNYFNLNEDKGGTLKLDSTTITVSPNSFTNTDGTEVTGDITISYFEYKSPADFILGNIPMSFIRNNEISLFESGGMFKILANQNGNKLLLKKASDKNIIIQTPLKKIPDQQFYNFDSIHNQWINSQQTLTDQNGNIISQNNRLTMTRNNTDIYIYPNCVTGDTCIYFANMFKKMNYYLTHREPLLPNNPYKSVKNNLVDYKSPFYQLKVDTSKKTLKFISLNDYTELGSFKNYEWQFAEDEFGKPGPSDLLYASFVKFIYNGESKFQIKMNIGMEKTRIYNVIGKSPGFHPFSKPSKLNAKNNTKYLKELYDLDNTEVENDTKLKKLIEITAVNELLFEDSLDCFMKFYTHFLCDSSEKKLITKHHGFYNYFNANKESILTKFQQKKNMFDCEKYKKDVGKVSAIEKLRISALAKFGINSLGMFNADRVKSIKDPETINATYKLKGKQQELKIIQIYLNIENLNGMIMYNGSYGYGPYHFVYGSKDKTVMIAVDEKFNSYFISPASFSECIAKKVGDQVTFILSPAKDLQTKQNLDKILTK